MLEQFVFAIAFDHPEYEEGEEDFIYSKWMTLVDQIKKALSDSKLPEIDGDRWEEFGLGKIFWGTKAECDSVKQVLLGFPIYILEERNLDAGYYQSSTGLYRVTDEGEVMGLSISEYSLKALGKLDTIPMDAYQIKTVTPEVEMQFMRIEEHQEDQQFEHLFEEYEFEQQQSSTDDTNFDTALQNSNVLDVKFELNKLEKKLEYLDGQLSKNIDPEEYKLLVQDFNHLHQQFFQYARQFAEFVAQAGDLEQQIVDLTEIVNAGVNARSELEIQSNLDGNVSLKHQYNVQQEQIATLGHEVRASTEKINQLQEILNQPVAPSESETLQEQLQAQSGRMDACENAISRLQTEVEHWQVVATSKSAEADYQILQQQVSEQGQVIDQVSKYIQDLEIQLANLQGISTNKVDLAEYETAMSQMQKLMVKRQESWLSRLFNWLRRN
uniref:Uncharacterized protein n=1 Tax=Cyanothece sp. (strain PCC 7425 / ATCC 29141) TaxID=395961 RepID=B8HR32_CYAP4